MRPLACFGSPPGSPSPAPLPAPREPTEQGSARRTSHVPEAGAAGVRAGAHTTQDPGVRVLASLAGGRKTMSTYLAMVLQFYGRPGDELLHVLVPAPFESHPEFFYPPRKPRLLTTQDGRTLSTAQARVELASVGHGARARPRCPGRCG
ncbi:MAG TPA: CRISPR-associated ring nuclease Csm6 [Limnochordales bacterium]